MILFRGIFVASLSVGYFYESVQRSHRQRDDVALFSNKSTICYEKIESDSYDSAKGTYGAQAPGANGDLGSNGYIELMKNSIVAGDVTTSASTPPGAFNPGSLSIYVGENGFVEGQLLASAGDLKLERSCDCLGNIGTSNGHIVINQNTDVRGNVDTATGRIELGGGSTVIGRDVSPGPGQLKNSLNLIDGSGNPSTYVKGSVYESSYGPVVERVEFQLPPTGDGFTDHTGGAGPGNSASNAGLVGGATPIPVEVRLIASTNRELSSLVEEGRFREDLYYRLKVFQLSLPPLRERSGDLELLVTHFVEKLAQELGQPRLRVHPDCLKAFRAYSWPGNVRELFNALRRMAAVAEEEILGEEPGPWDAALPDTVGR